MVGRRTLEFAVGIVAAAVVSGGLSLYVAMPYALAVGLAAGTPSLVRTSTRLDRDAYDAAKSSTEQVVDGALAAGATAAVGLGGGYAVLSAGITGPVASAVAAAVGVFAGQATFYARNREHLG
ncbi:uncharacterized protein HHUB_3185 [Halobacterium hubeiense]|jgi:hypothetical protein|uniref:Uncharacterized protein n=1 Tax=Halobacterium hubeiense TaxID=1407499 RepID=A0A0U5H572_9EURY|nr:hypothetical protein [Halobacterium hubeiense]CQH60326.1 uncharacterized protein HHUB_3185 [Halobacterium hubeiense]